VIQNLESYWVSPLVMAKKVSLLPAITLSAQVVFTTFFGILGLLLALPLTVVAKTWIDEALICDILDRCDRPKSPYSSTYPSLAHSEPSYAEVLPSASPMPSSRTVYTSGTPESSTPDSPT